MFGSCIKKTLFRYLIRKCLAPHFEIGNTTIPNFFLKEFDFPTDRPFHHQRHVVTDIPSIAIPTLVPPRTPFLTWKIRKILNSRELGDMLSFPGRYIIAASGSNPINGNHSVYFLSYWVAHKVCTLYPFLISFAHKLDSPP